MFTSLSIHNFRCFEALSFDGSLDRINLIAGTNSVGKTALLEAIYVLMGMGNVELIMRIVNFRGLGGNFLGAVPHLTEILWEPLFYNLNCSQDIEFWGSHRDGEHAARLSIDRVGATTILVNDGRTEGSSVGIESLPIYGHFLKLAHTMPDGSTVESAMVLEATKEGAPAVRVGSEPPIRPGPTFGGSYLAANQKRAPQEAASKYSRLESEGEPSEMLETLKIIEPRLRRIRVAEVAGTSMLRGDIGIGRMVPLSILGDGLGSLASMLLAIADAPGGVVLIDEIENGFHHTVLRQVWQAIGEAARRYDTQVFATTHSFECIEAAHEAFRENRPYAFRLHRLDRVENETKVITYDQETLGAAIRSGLEVR